MIKGDNLVVFDWNGTVLADTSACLRATNSVLEMLELPQVSMRRFRQHYTMPISHLYQSLGVDVDIIKTRHEEINPLWHSVYNTAKIRLRRGAKRMLEALSLLPLKPIILSNYVVHRIDEQAKQLGVRKHFENIIAFEARDATFLRRAKGQRLEEYIKLNPVKRGVIIGDSEEEIDIGKQLGLATIAITDGMCSTKRLKEMNPDFLITNLGKVPLLVKEICGTTRGAAS